MATIRNKRFAAFFITDLNAPATALSPTITIYDRTAGTTAVNAAAMSHIGNGLYEYTFSSYDYTHDYLAFADGGSGLTGANRYVTMGNESYTTDIADQLRTDHGGGRWGKNGVGIMGSQTSTGFTEKDIKALADRIIEELSKRELPIPYTIDDTEAKAKVAAYLATVTKAAVDAFKRVESPVVNTQVVEVKPPDFSNVLAAVELAKKETKTAIEAAKPDLQPVIEAVEESAQKTQKLVTKEVDGAYNGIMDILEDREEAEQKKMKAFQKLFSE